MSETKKVKCDQCHLDWGHGYCGNCQGTGFITQMDMVSIRRHELTAIRAQLASEKALREAAEARAAGLTLGYRDCLEDLICCGYQLDDYFQWKYGLDAAVAKHTEALKGTPSAR
jgi:hypothetical protein